MNVMKQFSALLIFYNILFSLPVYAESKSPAYELSTVKPLARLCSLDSVDAEYSNCQSYVTAISDMYFLINPKCVRPDSFNFRLQVLVNVKSIIASMPIDRLDTESAASVVLQAATIAYPCPNVSKSTVPNQDACKEGLKFLGNQFANSFEKQAILELLRNSGCLY